MRLIAAKIGPRNVRVTGRLRLGVVEPNGEEARIAIDRMFAYCRDESPERCAEMKTTFVESMVQAHRGEAQVTRERLTLVVRSDTYCREVVDYYARQSRQPLNQTLAPGLCILMMADFPNMGMVLHNEDISALGIEPAEAWRLARAHATANMPNVDEVVDLSEHAVSLGGYPNITNVLLDSEGWTRLAAREDFVIAVPEDGYIVIERRSRVTPEFREQVAQAVREAQRGVSAQLYRWQNGRWVVMP